MKIDGGIGFDPTGIAGQAAKAEASGYDGVWSAETSHDPFLPIAVGAAPTERLELGTGIAVAFARNPMTLAVLANDLQTAVQGPVHARPGHRQIKPHIEKRFSMPWSHPAAADARAHPGHPGHLGQLGRRASRSAFRGEFYTHTLMTPFFDPGPEPLRQPQGLPGRAWAS